MRQGLLDRAVLVQRPTWRLPQRLQRTGRPDGYDSSAALAAINSMVVRCYYDAINERNFGVSKTTHASGWVGRFRPGSHVTLRTREVNLARLEALGANMPELRFVINDLRVVGDLVIVRFAITGHGDDGVSRGFGVHRLDRGRIVDEYVVNPLLGRQARDFAKSIEGDARKAS